MTKLLPLSKWEKAPLAEREEFSASEDEESEECEDDQDYNIPLKKNKPAVPKPKPKIPNKTLGLNRSSKPAKRPAPPPSPPPQGPPQKRRKQKHKPSNIPSRAWPILGSEQAQNTVQLVYYVTKVTLPVLLWYCISLETEGKILSVTFRRNYCRSSEKGEAIC